MIRIVRSMPAPAHLADKGTDTLKLHAAAVAKREKVEFDNTIYGHDSVKAVLVAMQHKKCAFCEADVRHVAPGHVEHFRPKGGVNQDAAEKVVKPGYWWLAYEWENLLFACEVCNSRGKKNLFPLADPSKRCRKRTGALNAEVPVFINPADASDADPETLIDWRGSEPIATGGNVRARTTIDELGLARPDLWEHRKAHYRRFERVWRSNEKLDAVLPVLRAKAECAGMVKGLEAEKAENDALFADAVKDSAEYAGMIRAAVRRGFA